LNPTLSFARCGVVHSGLLRHAALGWAFFWAVAAVQGAFDVVVLDAGHGGEDGGAYRFNVTEKDLTLDLAKRVEKLLNDQGVKTVMTRTEDVLIPLEERAAMANRYPTAVFVSLHFNAHRDPGTTGLETYYLSQEGARFGRMVQEQLSRRFNTKDRGLKTNNLKVLRESKCPAILIECGFLTNRWENQRCAAGWYRQILAEEIVKGIMRFR
jgi:N-acetylmuramoyl-L-alanine amidase